MSSLLNATIGDYRLVDFLGAGGMSEVYRAIHTKHGRVVAIKMMTQPGRIQLDRFYNEARIQASLQHPAIAEYYGLHEFQGLPCLIMELVDGETLSERIAASGNFSPAEALAIFRQIVDAVAYVHSRGIIHRDLKSNNIKITPDGRVKLLDFGISRVARSTHLTTTGMLIGTLENIAPELIGGAEADERSDIWALGVLLFEMVTAKLPFTGETSAELYAKIRSAPCPRPSSLCPTVPRGVDAIIYRCLNKKPSARFHSATELLAKLTTSADSAGGVAWLWIAAAVILIAIVAFLQIVASREQPSVSPSSTGGAQRELLKTVTVDVSDGAAEVYRQDRLVGTTPFRVSARAGEKISLRLHRDGFQDVAVDFDVTERAAYTYTMQSDRR